MNQEQLNTQRESTYRLEHLLRDKNYQA